MMAGWAMKQLSISVLTACVSVVCVMSAEGHTVTRPHAPPHRRNRTQASGRTRVIVAVMASHCLHVKSGASALPFKNQGKMTQQEISTGWG